MMASVIAKHENWITLDHCCHFVCVYVQFKALFSFSYSLSPLSIFFILRLLLWCYMKISVRLVRFFCVCSFSRNSTVWFARSLMQCHFVAAHVLHRIEITVIYSLTHKELTQNIIHVKALSTHI